MSFKANFKHPELNGYAFPKKDVIVRVRNRGSEKLPLVLYNQDGTPKINPETSKQEIEMVWEGAYQIGVFINNSTLPIWSQEMVFKDYDPNKPAETQFYEDAKKLKFKISETKEENLFGNIEDI